MSDLADIRRRFANEIANRTSVQTGALVHALATVPREAFVPPGPWTIVGEGTGGAQATPDSDPRHMYTDVSVAIDANRQLFNGAPSAVLPILDALCLQPGHRVFHVGCGSGYYTALMATVVGSAGQVHAVEVDAAIAAQASSNLQPYGSVVVEHGDGTALPGARLDAILVHAGVTHPLKIWLDALPIEGRLVLPITASFPGMAFISKGVWLALTKTDTHLFTVRSLGLTMIYTALALRDDSLNPAIGTALMKNFADRVRVLRRDSHEPGAPCLLHGPAGCFRS
jgi:protein-L-isoaspartate(D-aspartate) O-methyltransferase